MIIRRVFATVLARFVPCDTPAAPQQKTPTPTGSLVASGAVNKEMQ
ncbi:hypothetical protein AB0K71_12975 [Streptomyces syringium]